MPHLDSSWRAHWVFAMAVGSAVGWGAFVLPYEWLQSSGLLAVVLGFIISTLLILVIGINYGYTVKALPVTGGGLMYALAALGKIHGFIAGWALTLSYACIVALNASAVALVFRLMLPDVMMLYPLYTIADWVIYLPEVLVSSAFILLFGWLNITNLGHSGRIQFISVAMMLIAVALVLVGALLYFVNHGSVSFLPLYPKDGVSITHATLLIIAIAPWAYVGFDSIPQLAGEFKFTSKKAMSLLVLGIVAATFIYLAMVLATALSFNPNNQVDLSSSWMTASVISSAMGKISILFMTIAVSMGVLTGLNGFYISTSRILFTMGHLGMIPNTFNAVHKTYKTPYFAIFFVMLICLPSPWFGRAALFWIVDMSSAGIALAFFYACYCSHKIGKNGSVLGMLSPLPPNKFQQHIGMLGCIISLLFLALLFVPASPSFLKPQSFWALVGWIALGVIFFVSRRTRISQLSNEKIEEFVKLNSNKAE